MGGGKLFDIFLIQIKQTNIFHNKLEINTRFLLIAISLYESLPLTLEFFTSLSRF